MYRALLLILLLALPNAAAAMWRRAASASFVVYSRGSDAEVRAKVQQLQQFDGLLHLLTGIPADPGAPPLPVFFASGRDLRTFGVRGSGVGGFYQAQPGGIYAVVATDRAREGFGNGVLSVLYHEYTHHFMFQNTRGSYPSWYVEGFAEYLMTVELRPSFIEYGDADPGRVYQLLKSSWLPMRRVLSVREHDLTREDDVSAFYAESWLAVHYLSRDGGRAKSLHDYLVALGRGTKPEAAFKQAFGVDYDEFDRQLRAYLNSHKITKSRVTGLKPVPDAEITVTVLPPSTEPLLLSATQLATLSFAPYRPEPPEPGADKAAIAKAAQDERERLQDRADLLATIRREAARFPDDSYAAAVLAEAEVKLGNRATGIAALDTLLAKSPDDPQLLYLRACAGMAAARQAQAANLDDALHDARVMLTRANKARPGDYRILAAHARTYRPGAMPDRELPVLMKAADLAPQVGEIQMMAAAALAHRNDRDGARRLLAPIANDPHGGPAARAAAAMIAALDGGEQIDVATDADLP